MRYLLEGPLDTEYSLAIVNRQLASALIELGVDVVLHQRDNTTHYAPNRAFRAEFPRLAERLRADISLMRADVHTRYIFPPHHDGLCGDVDGFHCYGWEESRFPRDFTWWANEGTDFVTTMSQYVVDILRASGVRVPLFNVGLGVDHILAAQPAPIAGFEHGGTFDFLHVSSCFPRKGVDVLLDSFCSTFTAKDDVRLVIKTFPNPHNRVRELVKEANLRYPDHAPVVLIDEPISQAQLRWLFEISGCLVAPSRGEGFGLPPAEAMLLRRPVIATPYSGHAEFCSSDTCWPVDFELTAARSHVSEENSVWAEPNRRSLADQLVAVRSARPEDLKPRLDAAEQRIRSNFLWSHVAKRQLDAIAETRGTTKVTRRASAPDAAVDSRAVVGVVSSWNTRCGIAEYSRYILSSLDQHGLEFTIAGSEPDSLVRQDEPYVARTWKQGEISPSRFRRVVEDLKARHVDVLSVQYNYGFFHGRVLDYLTERCHDAGIAVAITMHAVRPEMFPTVREALTKADLVIVHKAAEVRFLHENGISAVGLLPMGNPVPRTPPDPSTRGRWFTIGSFGFMLPFKGFYELLIAFAAAVKVNPWLRLNLNTSLHTVHISATYAEECRALIRKFELGSRVTLDTTFLDDQTVLDRLCEADLIVLPYTYSTESASAAIRLPLASMVPVLCSDLRIFNDCAEAVHLYQAGNTVELARKILTFAERPAELYAKAPAQLALTERFAWPRISDQFAELCEEALRRFRRTHPASPAEGEATIARVGN